MLAPVVQKAQPIAEAVLASPADYRPTYSEETWCRMVCFRDRQDVHGPATHALDNRFSRDGFCHGGAWDLSRIAQYIINNFLARYVELTRAG